MKQNKKPKIAIISLTCREDYESVALGLGERFLELTEYIDIVEFRMSKNDPPKIESYDICFVEGLAVTKKDLNILKKMRKASKMLIVLGRDKPKEIKKPVAIPIADIVKIDFTIPGCPINAEEFLIILKQILAGKKPSIPQNPVCYECQINGYECLLQKGEFCCGPITLGGCDAICLKNKQACWGCRGLVEEPDVEKFIKNCFLAGHTAGEITRALEVFDVKESWVDKAVKEWRSQQTPKI